MVLLKVKSQGNPCSRKRSSCLITPIKKGKKREWGRAFGDPVAWVRGWDAGMGCGDGVVLEGVQGVLCGVSVPSTSL